MATAQEIERVLKQLHEKDLRIQCRRRGISPAGGREVLRERVRDHMLETKDYSLVNEHGEPMSIVIGATAGVADEQQRNNYQRPQGQNVGNFLTDRPSSRVTQNPGGNSNVFLGGPEPIKVSAPAAEPAVTEPGSPYQNEVSAGVAAPSARNNYHRPGGQNVGNFITDRASTRVVNPPGGATSIMFG